MKSVSTILAVVILSIVGFANTSNGATTHLEKDPRQPLDRFKNPEYNAIGNVTYKIDDKYQSDGTGWLANPCLVWTAKHVIGKNKKIIGQKVKFSVGQSQSADKIFEFEVEGEVVASGNPDPKLVEGGKPDERMPDLGAQDWALIKLSKSIGKQVGFIKASQAEIEDAAACKSLEVAGFPREKDPRNLWHQGNCFLSTDSDATAFNVSCPVTPGNSGGPLLCRLADGSLRAIGIIIQQIPSNNSGLVLNFTFDKENSKAAYLKFRDSCN